LRPVLSKGHTGESGNVRALYTRYQTSQKSGNFAALMLFVTPGFVTLFAKISGNSLTAGCPLVTLRAWFALGAKPADATVEPSMFTERRGLQGGARRGLLGLACLLMIPTLGACAPVAGGAVVASVVAIAALTSHCYDYLDLTVFDGQGRKTCAATVNASTDGDHFELGSCYYAPLTDGVWTLRATLPGYKDATTTVAVEHAQGCARHVQSVELTLYPVQPLAGPSAAPQILPNSPPPAATTLPPGPPPAAPSAGVTAPTPPASASAVPGASAAPPLGVFPNSP
jgi:hypothetical protein